MMDWILASAGEGEVTYAEFGDLIWKNHEARRKEGGIRYLAAYNARTTGLANVGTPAEVAALVEKSSEEDTSKTLLEM